MVASPAARRALRPRRAQRATGWCQRPSGAPPAPPRTRPARIVAMRPARTTATRQCSAKAGWRRREVSTRRWTGDRAPPECWSLPSLRLTPHALLPTRHSPPLRSPHPAIARPHLRRRRVCALGIRPQLVQIGREQRQSPQRRQPARRRRQQEDGAARHEGRAGAQRRSRHHTSVREHARTCAPADGASMQRQLRVDDADQRFRLQLEPATRVTGG